MSNASRLKDPASINEREERLKCEFVEGKLEIQICITPSTWRVKVQIKIVSCIRILKCKN